MPAPAEHPLPLRPATPHTAQIPATLAFWEVRGVLKCPVAGICLTPEEQRKAVRKAGLLSPRNNSFDIHEMLVSWTDEENPLARRVNALLRKKYELQAAPLRRLNLLEFMKHWEEAFATGDFAVALWAAASRADMPETLHRHIFGCVHMAMHDALSKSLMLEKRLRLFRQEREKASEKYKTLKILLARAHKEQRAQKQQLEQALRARALLEAENGRLKSALAAQDGARQHGLEADNEALRLALAEHAEALALARSQAAAAERQLRDAVEEMDAQRQCNQQLKKELGQWLASSTACETCAASCGECASCPRRILIVGGMARMESLYRQLVEGEGGVLDYHDGYLGGGAHKLEKRLQRADLVLCPVNCNSHGACLLVKNLCKKYNKTVHMMPNFSLSAVSRVISGGSSNPCNNSKEKMS